jgi:lysophospholipid acyltransferase (LPLAT)-like uncharacterized protein
VGPAAPRTERGPVRRIRHRLRPLVSRPLAWLAALALPALYLAYLRLVWATSRVELRDFPEVLEIARENNGFVGALWHEEVFTVAHAYPHAGLRPHTLARVGDAGEVIARVLERCGFVVFRGGSASRRSRRRPSVLRSMIRHMQSRDGVVFGLTVDGSKGPAYRLKPGCIAIARECDKPIVLVRTWYRRCIRLRTWDREAIPLPFNRIAYYYRGPYFVPEDAKTREGLERFRLKLEGELIELAAQSYDDMGQPRPANLIAGD